MFHRRVPLISLVLTLVASAATTSAQVSKGHQVLIDRGLQLQGMVTNGDVFNLSTYQNANYTSINWIWDSNTSLQGAAPGMPWSRWVRNHSELPARPGYNEEPYLDQLFAIQVGDEANLNDPAVRDDYVARYDAIRASNPSWLPHTILWNNNFGGQVSDAALGDFIQRARPDMIGFDTYPYKANPTTHVPNDPPHGSPWTWYSDMRRYRQHALGANIPFSVYRQTFAAIETDGGGVPVREYRALSPSEMRLQTFAALGFGAKVLTDFTYNTGASTMFDGPGDLNPTPLYNVQKEINRQAKNLGPALVRLTPIHDLRPKNAGEPSSIYVSDEPFPAGTTTNILMLRGRFDPPTTPIDPNKVNPLPIGFTADPQAQNVNSWFEVCKNDPYLSGFGRTNLGNVESPQPGDAFISWFKPVDPVYDDPNQFDDQLYFMVVNGITSSDGSADTRQRIVLDFEKTDALFRSRHGDLNAPGDFPGLLLLDSDSGNVIPVPTSATQQPGMLWNMNATKWRLTLDLDGGMGMLFKFGSDPNSFIQFASPVPEPGALTLLPIAVLFLRRRGRGARR